MEISSKFQENKLPVYQEIIVEIPEDQIEKLNDYLENFMIDNLIGYYEILYEEKENPKSTKNKKIIFYFPYEDNQARWEIESILLSLDILDYFIDDHYVELKNYWEEYKDSFKPFMISKNFFLIPIWHKNNVILREDLIPIYIEPGMAFGTGLHPSTQLMIQWIDENDLKDKIILDAGCGSGILSIATLKKGAKLVYAFDIDINAIDLTKRNLAYNNLEDKINKEIFLYQGSWDDSRINNNYDVILANLTLPVFLKYQNQIKKICTKTMVFSGINIEQIKDLELLFNDIFYKNNIIEKDGWALLEMKSKMF